MDIPLRGWFTDRSYGALSLLNTVGSRDLHKSETSFPPFVNRRAASENQWLQGREEEIPCSVPLISGGITAMEIAEVSPLGGLKRD